MTLNVKDLQHVKNDDFAAFKTVIEDSIKQRVVHHPEVMKYKRLIEALTEYENLLNAIYIPQLNKEE